MRNENMLQLHAHTRIFRSYSTNHHDISLPELSLNYLPRLPKRKDFRIGCVGAGFIMRDCHLLAYQNAGFNPVAITSRDGTKAQAVAQQYRIPKVFPTVEELLADPEIEVLDVAVPPDVQPGILRLAATQGKYLKGILAQKPLAMSYRDAKECVDRCAAAGIKLAVNQNMRFDQSVRAMKDLLQRGWLGEPVLATIDMRAIPHWMPWSEKLHSLATFVMSIHHLDTFRYWFGTPDRVLASTRPDPRTKFPHTDGINLYILEYDSGLRATSCDDVWAGPAREGSEGDIGIRWRVEGTEGLARGTIGWPGYPARQCPVRSISQRNVNRATGCSLAGKRSGSRMPLSAPWPNYWLHSKKEPNRKSAARIIWRRSLSAKRCLQRRRSTEW